MRNQRHSLLLLVGVAAISLSSPGARADWSLIDNFDYLSLGEFVDGESGWQQVTTNTSGTDTRTWEIRYDPADSSNQALYLGGEFNTALQKIIPSGESIGAAETGTYYFRFRMADFFNSTGPSVGVGMSDDANSVSSNPGAPGQTSSYANILGVTDGGSTQNGAGTNTIVGYQDGSIEISNAVSTETWYSVWMVNDNSDDTYDMYIQGGSAFPSQTPILTDGTFRQSATGEFGPIGDLTRAFIRPNNANADTIDAIYFDDFFVDTTGQNLDVPGAPPALLQGDFDDSGTIDTTDLALLSNNLNETLDSLGVATTYDTYAVGDFNFNTVIDLEDFFLFSEAYAIANPGAAALTLADLHSAANVPEPSSSVALVLFGLAGTALLARSKN